MDEQPRLTMDEMRELLRRLDLDLLEPSDSGKIKVFLAGVIADAEAEGLEKIPLELEDEDEDLEA